MQLLKQKDVHIFFYNSLYFAYFEIKSIADFTDFLTRSFSAAVQRCASHKRTFKGNFFWLFDQDKRTYVWNTMVCIMIGMKSFSSFLLKTPSLKPNARNNKARRIKFHRYVRQFLPRDHGGFGHKNQKMSDFLGIAQKVRYFLILVPKTAIVSWQKWSNISMELAPPNVVLLLTLL